MTIDEVKEILGLGNEVTEETTWGDAQHDIALAVALAKLTGKNISEGTRAQCSTIEASNISLPRELLGIRNYVE